MAIENRPTVSIITPMYNVAGVLKISFDSLIVQTQGNLEVIYVDDCSTDNSLEVLDSLLSGVSRDDIDIVVLRHDKNRGVAAA